VIYLSSYNWLVFLFLIYFLTFKLFNEQALDDGEKRMGSANCLNYTQSPPGSRSGSASNHLFACATSSAYIQANNNPKTGRSGSGLSCLIETRFVELGPYGSLNRYSCRYPARSANQSGLISRSVENRQRDRRRSLEQKLERQEQKLLSLAEVEVDIDSRWRDRFMPREV
jgi:hypothetical protein